MALTAEQIAEQLRLKKEADAKKAAAEKAAAEKAAAELLKKQILQELDQINKATPTDPTEKAAAFAEIDAMSATYGGTLVQDILVELGATNGILPGDVLGAYTRAGGAPGGRARQTAINKRRAELAGLTPEEQAAAKAAATLNKKDKLKDSDSVVRPDDQTEGLKGEAYINLTSQTHQCILQHYMEDVAKYHRSEISRDASKNELNELLDRTFAPFAPSGKQKIILIDDKDPNSSVAPINALTSLGKTSGLSKLLPADLAKAMPKIRLYKIYRKKGKETGKIEFRFPTATDRGFLTNVTDSYSGSEGDDFTMTAGYAKGRAVGIKSFDWSFIGGDPFTATKDLTAKLTIFFQDFRDLTTVHHGANLLKRAGGPLEPYKYLDLIVQPDCRKGATIPANTGAPVPNTTKKEMVFNPDCYEIAVEVGYADTPGLPKA